MLLKEAGLNSKNDEVLSGIPYFRGLREIVIDSILQCSCMKELNKGNYLFMPDEIGTHLYIIKEGLIEVCQLGEDGKKIILYHAMRGAFLGDTVLFNEGRYGATAVAAEDSKLFSITKKSFEGLIYSFPEIGIRLVSDFGRRIERLKSLVAEVALSDVRKRIVRLLLELVESEKKGCVSRAGVDYRNSFFLTNVPTHDQMAHRIGTVREVLCKGLHKLEKENFIRVKRGNIIINDLNRLRNMILEDRKKCLFPIIIPGNMAE
jgi:CRP/FNR family cyclic AMP-dependent transcriptional regulator